MNVICRIEVTTISETGNDAMMPAIEDLSPTSREVLKNSHAIASVASQPRMPLVSAENLFLIIRKTIRQIGSRVKPTEKIMNQHFQLPELSGSLQ